MTSKELVLSHFIHLPRLCGLASWECPLRDLDLPIPELSGPMSQPAQRASESSYQLLWLAPSSAARAASGEPSEESSAPHTIALGALSALSLLYSLQRLGGLMEPACHFWVFKSSGQSDQNLDQLSSCH